jgi:imidazolonepropionase-like amidohydrolase
MAFLFAFIALLVFPSPQAQTRPLAITHVNVVDVVTGRILPNSTVIINGSSIASVTAGGAPPANAVVVEGRDKFLIPGLWDMHAHTQMSGEPWLALGVANGVTGIRDMGSDLDFILNMRDATASGKVLGPRIFAAGPILDDPPAEGWPFRMRVKTADDGRAAVQLLKRRGVDLIKVHDHTPREAYMAVADEARKQNLPLAGHVPQGIRVREAIEAGQGDIEHLSNMNLWRSCSGNKYQAEACKSFFEMLAQRSIWQTPTVATWVELGVIGTPASHVSAELMAYVPKSIREFWAANQSIFATPEVVKQMKAQADEAAIFTNDMAKVGVPILAGCDGMISGYCVHDELAMFVQGGMSPLAALQTATLNPAKYFKIEQTAGSIGSGKRADLVLLDANPLTDIKNASHIRAVILAGRLLDRNELDKMLVNVKAKARE